MNVVSKLIKTNCQGVLVMECMLDVTKKISNSLGRRKVQFWCDGLNVYVSPIWRDDDLDISNFLYGENLFCIFFLVDDCVHFLKINDSDSIVTFIYSLNLDDAVEEIATITMRLKELQDIINIIESSIEVFKYRLINV